MELPMRRLGGKRFAQPRQVGTLGGKVKAVELHVTGERDTDVCWMDQQAMCSMQLAASCACEVHTPLSVWMARQGCAEHCLTSASDGELRCRSTLVRHVGLGSPPQ